MNDEWETTEVLICGCGPTGALLSAYLGLSGIHNVVLEKELDITTDPRGISLDEDGIRIVQGLGLYEHIFTQIGTVMSRLRFIGGSHSDLSKSPFMCFDTSSTAGHTGHVGIMCHKQPDLERHLRSKIAKEKCSDLRSGCTLTSIWEDADWVYATYVDESRAEKRIRSRFLVGADGKTGFTRKHYLEGKGVELLWAEPTRYQETWVALNWKMTLPTPETHPSFPLWRLGYTPEQVYDLFFPSDFLFLCNPNRPAVCGRFGLPVDRLWRFEFAVDHTEDDEEMATPHRVEEVVGPYITHHGKRYGLSEDVKYPSDCIQVLRCRPFRFSARSCNKWVVDRVILCGDAAHVFPPFGGQGIASGFRDAIALSWRLAIACRSERTNVNEILAAWHSERKQQLEASLASTVRNGDMVNTRSPATLLLRDWGLWFLQGLFPPFRRWLELGPRNDGRMQYQYQSGMAFMPELRGGALFSQSYCVRITPPVDAQQEVYFTDDIIFSATKEALFQIVILVDEVDQLETLVDGLQGIEKICSRLSSIEASVFVRREQVSSEWPLELDREAAVSSLQYPSVIQGEESAGSGSSAPQPVFRTATAEEFEASPHCIGRPAPRGYREYDMWDGVHNQTYVIVRTDRFVFAACSSRRELELAATRLHELFP